MSLENAIIHNDIQLWNIGECDAQVILEYMYVSLNAESTNTATVLFYRMQTSGEQMHKDLRTFKTIFVSKILKLINKSQEIWEERKRLNKSIIQS